LDWTLTLLGKSSVADAAEQFAAAASGAQPMDVAASNSHASIRTRRGA
jgi:hypothetical protein